MELAQGQHQPRAMRSPQLRQAQLNGISIAGGRRSRTRRSPV
jgi:hypothetical protein